MPARDLQQQLSALREQLEHNPPMSEIQRAHLNELMEQIETRIRIEEATQDHDASLADGVNLAVERFEVEHPNIAATLRNIVQTLGNIGI